MVSSSRLRARVSAFFYCEEKMKLSVWNKGGRMCVVEIWERLVMVNVSLVRKWDWWGYLWNILE